MLARGARALGTPTNILSSSRLACLERRAFQATHHPARFEDRRRVLSKMPQARTLRGRWLGFEQ
eukprot:5213853-Alexandrium_andersonii.AAC.1